MNDAQFEPRVKPKHAEAILAVDASFFSDRFDDAHGIVTLPYAQFLEEAQSQLVIRQRRRLETDPQFRQLLPYILVRQLCVDGKIRYPHFRRLPGSGEAGLVGKVSVGFGGHIDACDIVYGPETEFESVIDLGATIRKSSAREAGEELRVVDGRGVVVNLDPYIRSTNMFLLNDDNPVCLVHVAIIQVITVTDACTVSCQEDVLETLDAMTAQEILDAGYNLEPWSRFIMEGEVANADTGSVPLSAVVIAHDEDLALVMKTELPEAIPGGAEEMRQHVISESERTAVPAASLQAGPGAEE